MKNYLMQVAMWALLAVAGATAQTPSGTAPPTQTPAPPATPGNAAPAPPAAESSARPSVEIRINDKEMEERLNRAFNNPEFERRIERQIERIGDRVDPNQWNGIAALALLVPLSGTALIALVAWMLYRRSKDRMQARLDMHTALLAKFNSGAEFSQFISSQGGREYMEKMTMPSHYHPAGGSPWRTAWIGYVCTAMGVGLFVVRLAEGRSLTGGIILLAIGIGHLLSMRSAKQAAERLGSSTTSSIHQPADSGSTQVPHLPGQ